MSARQRQPSAKHRPVPAARRAERRQIMLGVVLAGRRAADIAAPAVEELEHRLNHVYPSVHWQVRARRHHAFPAPREIGELLDCGRRRLLEENWTLALVISDLPLRSNGQPIRTHASRTHGVGIISLPALGPVQTRRRLIGTALEVVAALIGEQPVKLRRGAPRRRRARRAATRRRLRELATPPPRDLYQRFFALHTLRAHARILTGMVAANRPWRLAARLYRALVAAIAFVSFSVVNQGIWQLALTMGLPRLALAAVASLAIMVASLVGVHHLWERAKNPAAREQVVLFNAATILTLLTGVLTLYLVLLAAALLAAIILVPAGVLGSTVHRSAGLGDYLQLAWLMSSLATIGGALGAALESDAVVQEATYRTEETTEEQAVDLRPGTESGASGADCDALAA